MKTDPHYPHIRWRLAPDGKDVQWVHESLVRHEDMWKNRRTSDIYATCCNSTPERETLWKSLRGT